MLDDKCQQLSSMLGMPGNAGTQWGQTFTPCLDWFPRTQSVHPGAVTVAWLLYPVHLV